MLHSAYTFGPYLMSASFQGLTNPGSWFWLNASTGYPGYGYTNQNGHSGTNPFGYYIGSYSGVTHDFHCLSGPCPAPPLHNTAQFGFAAYNQYNDANILTGSATGWVRMQSAIAYLADDSAPTIYNPVRGKPSTAPDYGQRPSSAWRDDDSSVTWVSVELHDHGVGPYSVSASGLSPMWATSLGNQCAPPHAARDYCKKYLLEYTPPEGVSTITATGKDRAGRTSSNRGLQG